MYQYLGILSSNEMPCRQHLAALKALILPNAVISQSAIPAPPTRRQRYLHLSLSLSLATKHKSPSLFPNSEGPLKVTVRPIPRFLNPQPPRNPRNPRATLSSIFVRLALQRSKDAPVGSPRALEKRSCIPVNAECRLGMLMLVVL